MSQAKDIAMHYAWQLAVLVAVYGIRKLPWWKRLRQFRPKSTPPRTPGGHGKQFQLIHPARDYKASNPKWLISAVDGHQPVVSIPLEPGLAAALDRLTAPGSSSLPTFGKAAREQLFCLDPNVTYLNHGSYGATFRICCEVQSSYRQVLEAQPVKFMETMAIPGMQQAMQAVSELVQCSPTDVVPVVNATTAMNAVLGCVPLQRGDVVLVFNTTYPAVRSAAARVAARAGARLLEVQFQLGQLLAGHDPDRLLDVLRAAVGSVPGGRLKLACLDHIVSFPPVLMPVAQMAHICKQAGALVVVDGAHAVGSLADLNIPALGADFYTSNLHKWCCTPKGTAFLWCHPAHQHSLLPPVTSHGHGLGFQGEWLWQGTSDPCAWLAVPPAIRVMKALGMERLAKHNTMLVSDAVQLMVQTWPAAQLQVLGGGGSRQAAGMLAVSLPDLTAYPATSQGATELHDWLRDVNNIEVPVISLSDKLWVRLSAQMYNCLSDYQHLITCLDQCVRKDV